MNFLQAATEARKRIAPHVRVTPLERSAVLSQVTGGNVFLKLENYQLTGSFKLRGAVNKILSLSSEERAKGVVGASSGNHGAGMAQAMAWFHVGGTVFVPRNASPSKVEAIRRLGAQVKEEGETCEITERVARAYAEQAGLTFVAPYNDDEVIAGQGTIGLEIAEQFNGTLDAVFISVGGGGLISGVGGVLKALSDAVHIYGCSPEADCAMAASLRAGKIVESPTKPTLSDGTAGGVELASVTFGYCQKIINQFVLVSETEIKEAMRKLIRDHHMLVEGAAAVALAAFVKTAPHLSRKNVVIVLCGANVSFDALRSIL